MVAARFYGFDRKVMWKCFDQFSILQPAKAGVERRRKSKFAENLRQGKIQIRYVR